MKPGDRVTTADGREYELTARAKLVEGGVTFDVMRRDAKRSIAFQTEANRSKAII